jgi:uncharacterized protein YbdZ (MbtH family)
MFIKKQFFSFLLVNQQGWISMDVKPYYFCVSKGWIPSSASMSRIEAGWEIITEVHSKQTHLEYLKYRW